METKEELINNIKEWIKIDTEINQLQNEIKTRKERKKNLSNLLIVTMKNNDLECVDIKGGSLIYKKNKVKKPINAKSLMATLQNYYKNNPNQVEELTKFIMDNREEQVKETIRHKIDK